MSPCSARPAGARGPAAAFSRRRFGRPRRPTSGWRWIAPSTPASPPRGSPASRSSRRWTSARRRSPWRSRCARRWSGPGAGLLSRLRTGRSRSGSRRNSGAGTWRSRIRPECRCPTRSPAASPAWRPTRRRWISIPSACSPSWRIRCSGLVSIAPRWSGPPRRSRSACCADPPRGPVLTVLPTPSRCVARRIPVTPRARAAASRGGNGTLLPISSCAPARCLCGISAAVARRGQSRSRCRRGGASPDDRKAAPVRRRDGG